MYRYESEKKENVIFTIKKHVVEFQMKYPVCQRSSSLAAKPWGQRGRRFVYLDNRYVSMNKIFAKHKADSCKERK